MAEASDKDREDVNCVVCLDKLIDARYLRCFHSFCTQCLEHCIKNGKVSCPLCREVTCVSKGVDSLLPNLSATRRAQEARAREKIEAKIQDGGCQCESCSELGAVCLAKSYCMDCQLLICDKCVSAHKLLKLTRSHRIIGVLDFQNDVFQKEKESLCDLGFSERRCEKHSATLAMYCRPCQTSVCPQCAFLDHTELSDHECVSINDVGEDISREIRQLLSKIEPGNLDHLAQLYEKRLKRVADKAHELRSKINESAQNEIACVYAKIEAKRVALNTRILDIEKASCRKVTTALSSIRKLRTRAAKIDGYADEFLATGNPADVVSAKGALVDHVKDIRAEMRKLAISDPDVHDLQGHSFVPLDWMSSNYEVGVGRLENCQPLGEGLRGEPVGGRMKRRTSTRVSGRVLQRPNPVLPELSLPPRR